MKLSFHKHYKENLCVFNGKNELQRLCIENDCSPCNALYPHLSGEINTIKIISHNDNHHHNHPREHKIRVLRSTN
jgi:hypothetical protein